MDRKGQVSTAQQVIFVLLFIMLILGFMTARFAFDMRGKMQASTLAAMTSSVMNALSGMEQGKITTGFGKPWNITLTKDKLKFEAEESKGEADILGNVKETKISGAEKIQITKKPNGPVELTKIEE